MASEQEVARDGDSGGYEDVEVPTVGNVSKALFCS